MVDVVTFLLVALDRSLFRVRNEWVFCMSKSKLELCTWINGTGQPLTPTVRLSVRLLDPMHVCDAFHWWVPAIHGRKEYPWMAGSTNGMQPTLGRLLAYLPEQAPRAPPGTAPVSRRSSGSEEGWAQKRDRHHPLLS